MLGTSSFNNNVLYSITIPVYSKGRGTKILIFQYNLNQSQQGSAIQTAELWLKFSGRSGSVTLAQRKSSLL